MTADTTAAGSSSNCTACAKPASAWSTRTDAAPSDCDRASMAGSERKAARAAVDRDHRAGHVACERGREEDGDGGDFLGLAEAAERDLRARIFELALQGRIAALDLLAADAARLQTIDGDAVRRHLARQSLRPDMHGRLGGERGVEHARLGRAGEGDDAAPFLLAHVRHDGVRELTDTEEVEHHAFFPLVAAGLERHRPGLSRRIHQDVDVAEQPARFRGHAFGRLRVVKVRLQRDDPAPLLRGSHLLDQRYAPRHRDHVGAGRCEHQRGGAADALAGAGDERGTPFKIQVHAMRLDRFFPDFLSD